MEEAAVIMIQQAAKPASSVTKLFSVVSEDTDVYILLHHFYDELRLKTAL